MKTNRNVANDNVAVCWLIYAVHLTSDIVTGALNCYIHLGIHTCYVTLTYHNKDMHATTRVIRYFRQHFAMK